MHALIIEDEPLIAMEIEDILRSHGYTSIDFAVSAAEAVAAAATRCPDLITSDVQLNPGSGLDAVEEICRGSPIPVIFITCNTADVCARLPQYPALRKPFRAASLEAALALAAAA
jgi:DNA-binding response OmpR family regulator